MKTLSVYTTEDVVVFNYKEIEGNLYAPLTELQGEKIGFVELYEGALSTSEVDGYTLFKVRQTKRKVVKPESLEREFNCRLKKLSRQDISFDMDELLQTVSDDLLRMSEQTSKDYLVVYDHDNSRFLIDGDRGKSDEVLGLVKNIIKEDEDGEYPSFEVLMPEAFTVQPLLTGYVFEPASIPEPIILGDMIKLGKKAIAGKAPSAPNITIKDEDISSKEVLNHLDNHKVVHSLELDFDGCVFFNIDHTFKISGIKFEGSLKYKEDLNLGEYENFLAEYTLILPELSKMLNILVAELDK